MRCSGLAGGTDGPPSAIGGSAERVFGHAVQGEGFDELIPWVVRRGRQSAI
jgi:hypothetical protein